MDLRTAAGTSNVPSSSSPSSTSLHRNPPVSPQTFELSPILLVATLNGQLHALDRQTGIWNWTLHDPSQPSSSLIDHSGLIDSPSLSSEQPREEHELYAIEPWNGGDLYVFIKSSTQSSHLEKLPLSVSQLVNLSPFTFPGDSSKMFIGKKETHLIAIDLKTGIVINSLHSQPKHTSPKGKEKSNRYAQCKPPSPFRFPTSHSEIGRDSCPADPGTSSPRQSRTDDPPIHQRPRDLLYIGRTDYHVSIYSKPSTLIQTLRYSTYAPSNLPHGLPTMWTRTPDELYLEPTHDGNLVCFQATPQAPTTPPSKPERPEIKWQNTFDHPVTSVFDIVFPDAPDPPTGASSAGQYAQNQEHGSTRIPYHSASNASKSTSPQQPVIFVQPKFFPSKSDDSHNRFSSEDQFDLFKHLHAQTTFSTSSQSTPPIDQKRAFIGKYHNSFYVMSQQNYPLTTFAPPALQTLGNEPPVGTHILLNSQALNGFIDFSSTNRLLNPAPGHHDPTSVHSRLALDPAPHPYALPAAERHVDTTPSLNSATSSGSLTPSSSQLPSSPRKLPTEKAIVPFELHQCPAEISSMLVKAFKQQLRLNGPENSPANRRSDDRFPDLNPLLTFLLVLVMISWWASRKLESSPTARWEHLHRLVNQALGNDSKSEPDFNLKKALGTQDQLHRPAIVELPTTLPIEESQSHLDPSALGKPSLDGVHDPESLLPNLKQKPRRRRGKRPGQKAAAAAAKAQAESANALPLVQSLASSPVSTGLPLTISKPASSEDVKAVQKPKTNLKQSKLATRNLVVTTSESLDQVTLPTVSTNGPVVNNGIVTPLVTLSSSNDPVTPVNRPANLDLQPCADGHIGLEPQRVGSLIVTNETIGYGSHGTVVLRGTFQGRQVAVKRLLKDFVTLASHEVSLLQESDDHPNVIRYFVKESLNNFLYIALELCNASLYDFIEKRPFKEYEELERIFDPKKALKQITAGLRYLHKLKIVHRDVKPHNILISLTRSMPPSSSARVTNQAGGGRSDGKRFRMLISDFGLCKKLELDESSFVQTANHAAGSFGYRAPEILKGQVNLSDQRDLMASSSLTNSTVQIAGGAGVNNESNGSSSASNSESNHHHRLTRSIDIFSLGCIYYYVLTKGDHPFGSRYEREINILKDEVWLDQLDGLDEETFEAQQLIRSMIRSNPKERPTAEEVLQNPYFWEASKRLNFLCDCSDRFESMERVPPDETLMKLENQDSFSKYLHHQKPPHRGINSDCTSYHPAKAFDWYKMIDRGLVDNLGKYRRYDSGSIRDLLRVMRNKKHHFQDLPDGIKKSLGELPEGFLSYFSKKFPSLLVHVYDIVVYQSNLKFEKIFQSYFEIVDDI